MPGKILIGTASWTDPGFVADWYPRNLPASRRLRWYSDWFNFVEVNATFYAIPNARMVERWSAETPADFVFDVKVFKMLSRHVADPKFLPPDLRSRISVVRGKIHLDQNSEELVARRFLREIEPLRTSGKLGALLLQLSPAFQPGRHHLEELDHLLEFMRGYTVAVELRNRHWMTDAEAETTSYFSQKKVTLVGVDAPPGDHFTIMPSRDLLTNPALGYLRLHGRDPVAFTRGRTVAERFNYKYSESELQEIAQRAKSLAEHTNQVHVAANNNSSNYAPMTALRLREILGQKVTGPKELELFQRRIGPRDSSPRQGDGGFA